MRCWAIFDIDRAGAAMAWEDGNLPEPAWVAINRENSHAHISYGLEAPVLVSDSSKREPIRYLVAVESAYRAVLGGDNGYSGLVTKNPLNPHWNTLVGRAGVYDLEYISEFVDLDKFKLKKGVNPEEIGLGRNCITFDWLRHYAYKEVRHWKEAKTPGVFVHWMNHLYKQSLQRNGDFQNPMDSRECYHIAKSVARWVWNNFSVEEFSKWQSVRGSKAKNQSAAGKASGKARLAASEDKRSSALLMRIQGMSIRSIAEELAVGKSTVSDWFQGVR